MAGFLTLGFDGAAARRIAFFLGVLGAACPAAWAEDDGGSRSIFATGAGNRALAMGSAYTAVANDASTLFWNPGGLGLVPRLEVQAGQTSYFALGLSESYLAVAFPSWRWGTAAATFRHFGADGIEHRDERNVLLDDPIGYSETEFAVGYGRSLGEGLSLGGTLKARRQNLARLSASAFGLDLGVVAQGSQWLRQAEWAQNLSWGLSLRNLIEPSLRLDRESVSDPKSLRSGVAYHRAMGGARSLIAAVDLEKVAGGATTLRTGLELRIERMFALRVGLDGGTFTAGTGLSWRDLAVDYTYEQNPLDDVHRLGMSYAFGVTVSQSREAAVRAEESALQTRMSEAFQQRQAAQVASLLESVQRHLDQQEFDTGLEVLGTIGALDPGNPNIPKLEFQCLMGVARDQEQRGELVDAAATFGRARALVPEDTTAIAGERRCQEESDRRAARSAELRDQFAAAIDAFGADRLAEARTGFRRILEVEPNDQEAAAMLRRTEIAIARRTESLLQQASRYLHAGMLAEASRLAEQVAALDRRAEGLAALEAGLSRARQAAGDTSRTPQASRAEAPRKPAAAERAALTRQQIKEVELLYKRGLDAMNRHRPDDALRYWELVWSVDPGHQNVAEYLKREYLTRGMESFAAGRLDEAVGFWEKALQIDPNDARTIGYLARAHKQLDRTREILGGSR